MVELTKGGVHHAIEAVGREASASLQAEAGKKQLRAVLTELQALRRLLHDEGPRGVAGCAGFSPSSILEVIGAWRSLVAH